MQWMAPLIPPIPSGRPVCFHSCFSTSPQTSILDAPEVTGSGRCNGGPRTAGCQSWSVWTVCEGPPAEHRAGQLEQALAQRASLMVRVAVSWSPKSNDNLKPLDSTMVDLVNGQRL